MPPDYGDSIAVLGAGVKVGGIDNEKGICYNFFSIFRRCIKMKKWILLLLSILMIFGNALAEENEETKFECGNFEYIVLSDGTAEIVAYTNEDEPAYISIPVQLDRHIVSSIAGNPFSRQSNVEYFIVSPHHPYLTEIDGVLFSKNDRRLICFPQKCKFTEYFIPNGVEIIGEQAFSQGTSLKFIAIPNTVTTIEEFSFVNCDSLKSITLPESVITVESSAFSSCDLLSSITIPDSVTSIDGNPFIFCNNLKTIYVSPSHPYLKTIDGVLFFDDGRENRLVTYPCAFSATEYKVPQNTTAIGKDAFLSCESLRSITIPDGVISIDNSAFCYCSNLQSVILPESLISIGTSAFNGCSSLQNIVLPSNVRTLGGSAFFGCSLLKNIVMSTGITSIEPFTFAYCSNLREIDLSENISVIQTGAFSNCSSLQSIVIPEKVTSIEDHAFYKCSLLQSINIPKNVSFIGNWAFSSCSSLKGIVLPKSISSIGADAFWNCHSFFVISVVADSYGETYAIDNNLPFIYYLDNQPFPLP